MWKITDESRDTAAETVGLCREKRASRRTRAASVLVRSSMSSFGHLSDTRFRVVSFLVAPRTTTIII